MNEPFIGPATATDVPALNQLVNSAYRGESSRRGWTTEADLLGGSRTDEAALQTMLNTPNAVILQYVLASQLLGCVYLEKKHHQLYLGMLTVAPERQAGGIGRELLTAAEQQARNWHCQIITMTVIPQRLELLAWYERRGFAQTGAVHPFPDDPRFGDPKIPLSFVVLEKPVQS